MVGAAAGCEKLKPTGSLVSRQKPELVDPLLSILFDDGWESLLKGFSDAAVSRELAGSGLTLKMGLNNASLHGLKLNSDVRNPML